MMTLLLGFLLGLVASVIANLVTPFMKPLWLKVRSLQQRGYQAQIRQQIKGLQAQLDRLNARKAAPEKDLYLDLFQGSLGVFSLFVAGVACAFLGMTGSQARDIVRENLLTAALILFIAAMITSLIIMSYCRDLTTTGTLKKTAELEAEIATLTTKLHVS